MRTSLKLLLVAGGLLSGLVIAEGVASHRDEGAFPHVNFYVEDPALGVRLAPHAQQRISFGGNPVTTLETGAQGYRTPAWPAPSAGEVVIVGDSQVFGLGVEEADTLPSQLAALSGRVVLNGGVPTYGPEEYLSAATEIIEARGGAVSDLVIVLNFSNDLFEVNRPNRERHTVWDGWAIRIELAPEAGIQFPGRQWLFSQSHLMFALRQWMHTPEPDSDRGLPSEGSLTDIINTSINVHSDRTTLTEAQEQARQEQAEAYRDAGTATHNEEQLLELLEDMGYADDDIFRDAAGVRAVRNNEAIGDIVTIDYGEPSRSITVTAELLQRGTRVRGQLRRRVEQAIRMQEEDTARYYRENLPDTPTAVPAELLTESVDTTLWHTPFDDFLDQALALEAALGVNVTIVTLPLDVQVLPSQFDKYDAEPIDMSTSLLLLKDVAEAAQRRGMWALNPTQAIRDVGDVAYLDQDLHLSAVGHNAVAVALQETLSQPKLQLPGLGIPEGRSRVPVLQEFYAVGENYVRGSTRNRCATFALREWFYMSCTNATDEQFVGVHLAQVPEETFGGLESDHFQLWMPLFPGRDADIDVVWDNRQEQLQVRWSADGTTPEMAFEPLTERSPETVLLDPEEPWRDVWLGSATSCNGYLCSTGQRLDLPSCEPGTANAGSAGHCLSLCSADVPCASGICSDWMGGRVCL